jgi:surface antigen
MPRTRLRTAALTLAVASLFAVGTGVAPASAATTSMTIRGTVICASGHDVVGVWIESTAGGSRFSAWTAFKGHENTAYYETTIKSRAKSTKITVRVGCGGSPADWWSDNGTPRITVTGSRTLNTRCVEAAGTGTRCAWPWVGQTVKTNLGARGNCTWGALAKWKAAVGTYPRTAGNAGAWNDYAKTVGWYVSGVPHVRSMVIFEPWTGGSFAAGHVGWVTGVKHVGGGKITITVIEMNAGTNGFNRYRTHVYPHVSGDMSYIVAPVTKPK